MFEKKTSLQAKTLYKRAKTLMNYDVWLSGVNKQQSARVYVHLCADCRNKTNAQLF